MMLVYPETLFMIVGEYSSSVRSQLNRKVRLRLGGKKQNPIFRISSIDPYMVLMPSVIFLFIFSSIPTVLCSLHHEIIVDLSHPSLHLLVSTSEGPDEQ